MISLMDPKLIVIVVVLLGRVQSWKTCHDTFCERIRKSPEGYPRYTLSTPTITNKKVEGNLVSASNPPLKFTLTAAADSTFRLLIEDEPNVKRHRVPEALNGEFPPLDITAKTTTNGTTVTYGKSSAKIYNNPFMVEFYNDDKLVSVVNAKNRFAFETAEPKLAIAMDILFVNAQRAYGIPEHADRLTLRNTVNGLDPYRHYNIDYGHYKVISTESSYGTIPVLYAHGTTQSSGIFWLNSAQTWIDIMTGPNDVNSFFMSESGALEMFIFTGPTLPAAVKQYAKLTGVAPLPQYFTLGYHQSRYSYMSQVEVTTVVKQFDVADMPVDVMWLDIDYTDQKKYFTWDPVRYPKPLELQDQLAATNRKLVAIIDPHFKVDDTYFLHQEATEKGYYVKMADGKNYEGECWPGKSSYLDFLNPEVSAYYASLYSEKKEFKTKNIHIWNDMNEPAVFNNPEHDHSFPSDLVHYGGIKHRDVHNIYGFHQVKGTHKGLLDRGLGVRPFILTRAHFAGIQRYAAMWTGDNYAEWSYLQISYPMCLTEALAGVSFCGADVGGFGGVPEDELLQRWYQAGAWLPFYRGHSATDVPRREPYLYSDDIRVRLRTALRQRYSHLPVWYTLFREHELTGEPVIRPITYQYPNEDDALSIDNEILVGTNILVAPVLEKGVALKSVYLPGGASEIWYNIDDDYKRMNGSGYHLIRVDINSVPVFYRGGSIITRKDTPRPTTVATHPDPYTLYICLSENKTAEGTLYVDDYESYKYRDSNEYLYIKLAYADNVLSSSAINTATYDHAAEINRAIILNPPSNIGGARFVEGSTTREDLKLTVEYNVDGSVLTINGIATNVKQAFKLELLKSNAAMFKLSGFALCCMIIRYMFI